MSVSSKALNFISSLPAHGNNTPLAVRGNALVKSRLDDPEESSPYDHLQKSLSDLLGSVYNDSPSMHKIEVYKKDGRSLTKEKIVKWVSKMIGDETLQKAASSLNAIRKIPALNIASRLVLAPGRKKFVEAADCPDSENAAAVQYFKSCLCDIYGPERVDKCQAARLAFQKMEREAAPLTKIKVVQILMALSDVRLEDLQRGIDHIKVVQNLRASSLDEDTQRAISDFTIHDDIILGRLANLDGLINSLGNVKNVDDLTQEQFQDVLGLFNPLSKLHLTMTGESAGEIESTGGRFWSKLVYDWDWGHWLGRKNMCAFRRLNAEQIVEEIPAQTFIEKMEGYKELLAKGIAYHELKAGMLISAPPDDEGNVQSYRVAKEFVSGEGMVAYLLVRAASSMRNLPPTLLFRGTPFSFSGLDAISNFIADLEPNIGETAYDTGKGKIFESFNEQGHLTASGDHDNHLMILGHSFGGAMCQRFLHDFINRKSRGELQDSPLGNINFIQLGLYNAPGLEDALAAEFAEKIDSIDDLLIEGVVYKTKGDFFHDCGVRYVGSRCNRSKMTYEAVVCSGNDIDLHLTCFFDKEGSQIEGRLIERFSGDEAEALLTNEDHLCYENTRQVVGFLFYILLKIIRCLVRLFFSWRGAEIIKEPEVLQIVSATYLEEVDGLIELLNLSKEVESNRSQLRRWFELRIERWLEANGFDKKDAGYVSFLDQMDEQEPAQLIDKLLFGLLEPMLPGSIEEFKAAVQFDRLVEELTPLLQEAIADLKSACVC